MCSHTEFVVVHMWFHSSLSFNRCPIEHFSFLIIFFFRETPHHFSGDIVTPKGGKVFTLLFKELFLQCITRRSASFLYNIYPRTRGWSHGVSPGIRWSKPPPLSRRRKSSIGPFSILKFLS